MSQTENRAVRRRDEQMLHLVSDMTGIRSITPEDRNCARRHILEAEARGAEEQRQNDAGGQERWEFSEPDYHDQGMGCGLEDRGIHDRYEAMAYGWDQAVERCVELIPEELYTRPANVAALEVRVKVLEEAKGRKQEEARRYRNALLTICDKTSEYSISHQTARASLDAAMDAEERG